MENKICASAACFKDKHLNTADNSKVFVVYEHHPPSPPVSLEWNKLLPNRKVPHSGEMMPVESLVGMCI